MVQGKLPFFIVWVVREVLSDKVTCDQRPEGSEEISFAVIWGKSVLRDYRIKKKKKIGYQIRGSRSIIGSDRVTWCRNHAPPETGLSSQQGLLGGNVDPVLSDLLGFLFFKKNCILNFSCELS